MHRKLGHVILAAPDLDIEVASQRIAAEALFAGTERFTVYVSGSDKAIWLSSWLFDSSKRVGRLDPEKLSERERLIVERAYGIDFVDARVKTGWVGHSYFHEHPAVSSDLILILRDGKAPGAAHGRPLEPISENTWRLREDYPPASRLP